MAKNKKERVIIEDIELKPQVLGYTYKKKSNIGRVIIIFIAFILVVYYINDISIFINNLLGKKSAESIQNYVDKTQDNKNNNLTKQEVEYHTLDNNLNIKIGNITLNNFKYENNKLSFDILNSSNNTIDLSNKKYFLETFNENKTLLERFKIDVKSINTNSKITNTLDIKDVFTYIVVEEKNTNDYPIINIENDNNGIGKITCTKNQEIIIYTFTNNELTNIKHTINDSNINDEDYYTRYNYYQTKTSSYNNITGINATFNSTLNGYTAIITIDLKSADLSKITESYYYGYKEEAKVVHFEMQTYGFTCN